MDLGAPGITTSEQGESSYIGHGPNSWIDHYYLWAVAPGCCTFTSGNPDKFCQHKTLECKPNLCQISIIDKRIQGYEFKFYVSWFLKDIPDDQCMMSGYITYKNAVDIQQNETNKKISEIGASNYKAYHVALRNRTDYTKALKTARVIADRVTAAINEKLTKWNVTANVNIFPYSEHYIYYENFFNIWYDVFLLMGLSLLAVFLAVFFLMGLDVISGLLVVITIAMNLVNLVGFMYIWSIPLNYISIINLVTAVGMSICFCVYLVHCFSVTDGATHVERAWHALVVAGSCVAKNMLITKFLGAILLVASQHPMIKMFFKIYMGIILIGAVHGLILLPVLLSYFGVGTMKPKTRDDDDAPYPETNTEPAQEDVAITRAKSDDIMMTRRSKTKITDSIKTM